MVRPKRGSAVLVGAAEYRLSCLPRTNLTISDIWPTRSTLAAHRINLDSYKRMYEAQGGRCAICSAQKDPNGLVIDHNHKTGKVRGLLCPGCNTGLGLFKDSPDVLELAMQYLEERGCYGPDALAGEVS